MLTLLLGFAATLASIPSTSAYSVTTQPWQTNRPVPGGTIFYSIVLSPGDPVLVDILLLNADRGNTTLVFGNSDLSKSDELNAGFDLPTCPPGHYSVRLVETSTKRFLADSPQFQVYPIGTPPSTSASSAPPTSISTQSTKPTQSPIPTGDTNGTSTSKNASTRYVIIGAGAAAGLLLIGVAICLYFYCHRRKDRSPVNSRGTLREKDLNALPRKMSRASSRRRTSGVQPFPLEPLEHPASSTSAISINEDKRVAQLGSPVSSKHAFAFPPLNTSTGDLMRYDSTNSKSTNATYRDGRPRPSISSRTSTSASQAHRSLARAEQLRLQRELLNREIATLESQATISPSRDTFEVTTPYDGPRPAHSEGTFSTSLWEGPGSPGGVGGQRDQSDLTTQLAALRAQINQIERGHAYMDLEPPPEYDDPPSEGEMFGTDSSSRLPGPPGPNHHDDMRSQKRG